MKIPPRIKDAINTVAGFVVFFTPMLLGVLIHLPIFVVKCLVCCITEHNWAPAWESQEGDPAPITCLRCHKWEQ